MPEQDNAPEAVELDWDKESLAQIDRVGARRGINPRRRERIEEDIRFDDLLGEVLGQGRLGEFINCPFHGSDATPSFRIYIDHGFCFGCPPKKQYYDHVRFVKEYQGVSWIQALIWIENKYGLDPLPNVDYEEDEAEERDYEEVSITFEELRLLFLEKAYSEVSKSKDWELAQEYQIIYFDSIGLMDAAKEWKKTDPDEATKMAMSAKKNLAVVVGQAEIDKLLSRKLEGENAQ
jgi:hypothetical protein